MVTLMMPETVANRLARAYYGLRAPGALATLEALAKSQWWSAERLRCLQQQRLLALLQHAFTHVPYYRDLLRQIGADRRDFRSLADLPLLPSLTRHDLHQHGSRLLDERADVSRLKRNATGGSTGTPVQFYQDTTYWRIGFASMWRAWFLFPGYDLGVRHLQFWGADRDQPHQLLRAAGRIFFNQSFLNSFRTTTAALDRALTQVERFAPRLLIAYASSADLLARHARRHERRVRIPSVVTSAETLAPEQRQLIAETFGARIHNCYGCREIGAIAQQCEASDGLHVNVETQVVEFEPVDPAQPQGICRVLVTHLGNTVMPLIRYELGDTVLRGGLQWERCACGRALPRMQPVIGRVSDIIRTPAGHFVHGEYFTHLFYNQDVVSAFQVHQTDLHRLVIRVVPGAAYHDRFIEQVRQWIVSDHGFRDIEVEVCEQIEPAPSGKLRFTRSDVDPRAGNGSAADLQ